MAPCPFWTFWLHLMKMDVKIQQFTENPTHTDLYLQWDSRHTVSSKYSVIGTLHHRAETICSSNRKKNIYRKHSKNVNTLHGLWVRVKIKTKVQPTNIEEMVLTLAKTTITRNHARWGWVRTWRKYAVNMQCRSILKEATPSRISWWLQKIKILSRRWAPSPIYDHFNTTGHNITIDYFSKMRRRPEPQQSNKRSIVHKGQ